MTDLHLEGRISNLRAGAFHALLAMGVLLLLADLIRAGHDEVRQRPDALAARPSPLRPWETASRRQVYFAAPSGRPGNAGSAAQPLDLASALSARGPLHPGDLLWLRGGNYRGNFVSALAGTAEAMIVVAQFPGERAILDGVKEPTRPVLRVDGAYTVYWGFEVTNSAPELAGRVRGTGVDVFGPYTKFINLVVHHTGNGMGVWTPALEAELYGNLIADAGWEDEDRGHGHSIYIQNDRLTKRVVDNVLFDGHSYGVHAFTQVGQINNLYFEGNIAFDHGTRSKVSGPKANFLVGGHQSALHPVLTSNYGYYPWSSTGRNADVGYINGCADARIQGNYLAGGTSVVLTRCADVTMRGNRFIGQVAEATAFHFPQNEYSGSRPAADLAFVRPNRYVRGRGNIAIFNWNRHPSVRIDLSGLGLRSGERFEIRDVRNYFGAPLLAAVYTGSVVDLPVANMKRSPDDDGAPSLPPEFGAAVVLPADRDTSYGPPWNPAGRAARWWQETVTLTRAGQP